MSSILWINGFKIDLVEGQTIAQTKQVDDLAGLEKRESNYTNRFKGADTANNRAAFAHLALPGNKSRIPYQKNEAYLFSKSGECFVYKGWANVTSTGKEYDIYIYDGIIDFYKAIENRSLSELELEELDHTKNLETVLESWEPESPYRYILADYGGKLMYGSGYINIDYQVPSVNTKWLWDKLFEYHGYTYSGSVFDTEDFNNHWLTFPKGVFSTVPDEEKFSSTNPKFEKDSYVSGPFVFSPTSKSRYLSYESVTLSGATLVDEKHIVVSETGLYRVQITGSISIAKAFGYTSAHFNMARNSESFQLSRDIAVFEQKATVGSSDNDHVDVNLNFLVNVGAMESICFFIRATNNIIGVDFTSASITVSKVVSQTVSFYDALTEFAQKEFFKEVLVEFGLTPFKEKYSNNIKFLTLQERLQSFEVDDWTDKYVEVENESYTIGSYAQKNTFSFKYNDKESDYNDGAIIIDNVNLEESRQIIESKVYSPERNHVIFLDRPTNTYKLWEKEISSDETVTYKPLDKRFYFLRSMTLSIPSTPIGSETLATTESRTSVPVESFFGMKWSDRVRNYYLPIQGILNDALVQTIKLNLDDADVIALDFKKLKYFEQEGAYYILNRLINYVSGKSVKGEFIRVKLSGDSFEIPDIPEEPEPIGYCVAYQAANLGNIKMSLHVEIDFVTQLAGRTINTSLSVGTITQYLINGTTVTTPLAMNFTSTKAIYNSSALPHVHNKVLTSISVLIEIVCNDASEITLDQTFGAIEVPGVQMESEFSQCY